MDVDDLIPLDRFNELTMAVKCLLLTETDVNCEREKISNSVAFLAQLIDEKDVYHNMINMVTMMIGKKIHATSIS